MLKQVWSASNNRSKGLYSKELTDKRLSSGWKSRSTQAVQHYSTNQDEALGFNTAWVPHLWSDRLTWKYSICVATSDLTAVRFKQVNRTKVEPKYLTSSFFGPCHVYISADSSWQSFHAYVKRWSSRRVWLTPICSCWSEMYLNFLNLQEWAGNLSAPGLPTRMAGIKPSVFFLS